MNAREGEHAIGVSASGAPHEKDLSAGIGEDGVGGDWVPVVAGVEHVVFTGTRHRSYYSALGCAAREPSW